MDLHECVGPKQFHDVVGGYQRYDVFDLNVNRQRRGPETIFDSEKETLQPSTTSPASQGLVWLPKRSPDDQTGTDAGLARLRDELTNMKAEMLQETEGQSKRS
jgi:aliphatic nitrilase